MKLTKLANSYLKFMFISYSNNHMRIFHWKTLREQFPEQDEEIISDACRLLSKNGLVRISWRSNIPYRIELDVIAVLVRYLPSEQ